MRMSHREPAGIKGDLWPPLICLIVGNKDERDIEHTRNLAALGAWDRGLILLVNPARPQARKELQSEMHWGEVADAQ